MTDKWLVVGSSPSAYECFRFARYRNPDARVVTTNGGIDVCLNRQSDHKLKSGPQPIVDPCWPDVYFLTDAVAQRKFADVAREAQSHGSQLWALKKKSAAIKAREIEHYDRFVDCVGPGADWWYRQGTYSFVALSGLYTLQIAINEGATELHIVGHEGYRSGPSKCVVDYCNGDLGHDKYERHMTETVIPFYDEVVRACPDVAFHFYGAMSWHMGHDNVHYHLDYEEILL